MNMEMIGGISIFRPRLQSEVAMRAKAEQHLRQTYGVGVYNARDGINTILQHQFGFYDATLKQLIPHVASRHFMEFVLAQYDFSADIDQRRRRLQLTEAENARWDDLGPIFRRAVKYLAEVVAMLAPDEAPQADENELLDKTDACWICAEELVKLSQLSSQTYMLFPKETILDIRQPGELDYLQLRLHNPDPYTTFGERVRLDTATRKNYINEAETIYCTQRIEAILDAPARAACGFGVSDAISFGFAVNSNTLQPGNGFDIPFVHEEQLLDSLCTTLSIAKDQAERLLNGLALRRSEMLKEGRVVWKPKQEYRAYTRPFFEFPHPTGMHLTWSRRMAEECLMQLFLRLAQKHIPPEWRLGDVPPAVEDYVASITKAFEQIVNSSLRTAGLSAERFKSHIGQGPSTIQIPNDVGEIDSLGYLPREGLLIVGECKVVKPTNEPATFRDDLGKFLDKDGYVDQLRRKTEWVQQNADAIGIALESVKGFPNGIAVTHVAPVLVTYYPAFASCFIADVPCVSLSELMATLKRRGGWTYTPVFAKK